MTIGISAIPALSRTMQGEEMLQPEEVAAMLRLHELGWGAKRLAKEFGCARNTVRRYLREGGTVPFRKPVRRSAFDGLDDLAAGALLPPWWQRRCGAPGTGERTWDRHRASVGGASGAGLASGVEGAEARNGSV